MIDNGASVADQNKLFWSEEMRVFRKKLTEQTTHSFSNSGVTTRQGNSYGQQDDGYGQPNNGYGHPDDGCRQPGDSCGYPDDGHK